MRIAMIAAGNALAVLLYGVGLIGPLTPSEGLPHSWELVVFGLVPAGLLGACLWVSRTVVARVIISAQILMIITFTGWLLWLQYRMSA